MSRPRSHRRLKVSASLLVTGITRQAITHTPITIAATMPRHMDITDRGTDTITTGVTIRIPTIVATITDIAIDITAGGITTGSTTGITTNR